MYLNNRTAPSKPRRKPLGSIDINVSAQGKQREKRSTDQNNCLSVETKEHGLGCDRNIDFRVQPNEISLVSEHQQGTQWVENNNESNAMLYDVHHNNCNNSRTYQDENDDDEPYSFFHDHDMAFQYQPTQKIDKNERLHRRDDSPPSDDEVFLAPELQPRLLEKHGSILGKEREMNESPIAQLDQGTESDEEITGNETPLNRVSHYTKELLPLQPILFENNESLLGREIEMHGSPGTPFNQGTESDEEMTESETPLIRVPPSGEDSPLPKRFKNKGSLLGTEIELHESSELDQAGSQSDEEMEDDTPTCNQSASDEGVVLDVLPSNYEYKIVSLKHLEDYYLEKRFTAVIRVNIRSKEEAIQWVTEFEAASDTDMRVLKVFSEENRHKILFKKSYRCHHDTLADSRNRKCPHEKHTKCSAGLIITVKNPNMPRSKDKLLTSHPCEILLKFSHNHFVLSVGALKHRRPSPSVRETLLKLFKAGHSPASALETYLFDLQGKYDDDEFYKIHADSSKCPRKKWCYNIYYGIFKKEYGEPTGEEMLAAMEKLVADLNAKYNKTCAKVLEKNGHIHVAICTPLMMRVLQLLRSSGEIIFVDSSGTMDACNSRVFMFLAPSVCGGLPIGIIIVSSESEEAITEGLKLLLSLFPEDAFNGKGAKGPLCFMTDDCAALRNSLKHCFYLAILLLCIFHILQAVWRYLWNSKHGVLSEDRSQIYLLFHKTVHCNSTTEFLEDYEALLGNSVVMKYKCVADYLEKLFDRKEEWAPCYRASLLIRGHNTNNYSEANVRVLKDLVLHRTKAFNVVQLFDILTTALQAYYERRILDVLANKAINIRKSRHFFSDNKINSLECSIFKPPNLYKVKNLSKNTEYIVNTEIDTCGCPVGKNGAPCKHQFAVCQKYKLSSFQFLPTKDPHKKLELHKILYGTVEHVPPHWYSNLTKSPAILNEQLDFASNMISNETTADSTGVSEALNQVSEIVHASNYTAQISEERKQEAKASIIAFSEMLSNKVDLNPDAFVPAVEKLQKELTAHQSFESWLESALYNFGKTTAPAARSCHSTKAVLQDISQSLNRYQSKLPAAKHGKNITVQPTTIARRCTAHLGGRRVLQTGRPPKSKYTSEHGYHSQPKISGEPTWAVPPKKKLPAPHSLSACVQSNVALGKGHCKK